MRSTIGVDGAMLLQEERGVAATAAAAAGF